MLIDPNKVTKFDRTDEELETFFVYSVAVAGRQAKSISRQVQQLLDLLSWEHRADVTPLALINFHSQTELADRLMKVGIGCYNQKSEALCRAAGLWVADLLNLRTCTVPQLEEIRWLGPKTARFFVLHSRPNARVAAIDTHILKHLAANGVKVPAKPPSKGNTYLRLEREFLKLADQAGMSPADYDLMVWKEYANAG